MMIARQLFTDSARVLRASVVRDPIKNSASWLAVGGPRLQMSVDAGN